MTPALGKAMSDQWGMQVEAPCPARHELESLCVHFIVGGERLEVSALDLILHDEDDDRQCNRIRLDGGLESHDMVFGQALLAGLEACLVLSNAAHWFRATMTEDTPLVFITLP